MPLTNQTAWVVGGVGVVGRGITRGLLQVGATVIVNSRSEERLQKIQDTLGYPENLITVNGSLLPGEASYTTSRTLEKIPLHHVVAHGAVRWWARQTPGTYDNIYEYKAGCDETYALNIKANEKLLDMRIEEFGPNSCQLASLHLNAAQSLIPRLYGTNPTYTFVTGDGSGKPGGDRTAMGEINSHQVWGLSAALRHELRNSKVICREIRVGIPVQDHEKNNEPVSEDIGDLCAGLVSHPRENGRLIKLDKFEDIKDLRKEYNVTSNNHVVKDLPHLACE